MERQVIAWFEVDDAERFRRFPISIITDDLGEFYIFPPFDHPGLKVGACGKWQATLPYFWCTVVDTITSNNSNLSNERLNPGRVITLDYTACYVVLSL